MGQLTDLLYGIAGQAATAYVSAQFPASSPAGPQNVETLYDYGVQAYDYLTDSDGPGPDPQAPAPGPTVSGPTSLANVCAPAKRNPYANYTWDGTCWRKRRRRRRKRLATPTDLKDLAALKGVLGAGEAFKVWVATHGS